MDPIRSIYEDDEDMMEIIREFAADLPDRAASLEHLLASENLAELQTLAHQLKGAGGGYGFGEITDAAATLEQSLKACAEGSVLKEQTHALCEILRAVVVDEAG